MLQLLALGLLQLATFFGSPNTNRTVTPATENNSATTTATTPPPAPTGIGNAGWDND